MKGVQRSTNEEPDRIRKQRRKRYCDGTRKQQEATTSNKWIKSEIRTAQ